MNNRTDWKYLLREAVLILGLSYALWLGGTLKGFVYESFRQLSLIGLGVAGSAWLIWRWRSGGDRRERLRLALLAFLLALGVATAASADPRRSMIALWQAGLAVWLFWLVCDLLAAGWPAELWVKSLLVAGTIPVGLGVLVIARWYSRWLEIGGLANPVPPVILRVWTLPGHPNYVAGTLNLLWPLALARLLGQRKRLAWILLGAYVLGAWFILFFTSSRGGWLGAAAALGVLGLLWVLDRGGVAWLRKGWSWIRPRRWLLVSGGTVLLVLLAALGMLAWKQVNHPSHGSILQSRQEFWPPAWEAFLRKPTLGIGPFTFAGEFNRANSVPPKGLFTHAHSIFLNMLAESGLVGFMALLGAVGAAGWGLVRAWRSTRPGRRVELMGAVAALTSAAVHGLFDTVQMMPTLAMLLVIVAAIGLHSRGEGRPGRGWAAPLLWAVLVITGARSLWGYAPATEGVLAGNLEDWAEALPFFEEAIERDPTLGINHYHAAFARGTLAAEDAAHLEPAIAHYRAGLVHDPDYAPHHANLAALLWQAGWQEEAIVEMETAEALAPQSAVFPLGLGVYYEEIGDTEAATAALERAAELGGGESTHFWRSTPLRAEVFERVSGELEEEDGWAHLAQGDTGAARQLFQDELNRTPNSVPANRGLAAVAMQEGDRETTAYYLQTALFIGSTYDPREHLRAQMDWARLAARGGDPEEATSRAEPVLDAFRTETFWGYGRYGTADYGWYVYYRESLLQDMLPQLVTTGLPDEAGGWMVEVANWQRQLGDLTAAGELCENVLEAIPDSVAAAECLDELAD